MENDNIENDNRIPVATKISNNNDNIIYYDFTTVNTTVNTNNSLFICIQNIFTGEKKENDTYKTVIPIYNINHIYPIYELCDTDFYIRIYGFKSSKFLKYYTKINYNKIISITIYNFIDNNFKYNLEKSIYIFTLKTVSQILEGDIYAKPNITLISYTLFKFIIKNLYNNQSLF